MTNERLVRSAASPLEKTRSRLPLLFVAAVGTIAALKVLPGWLPGLAASLAGATPPAYWDLVRSTGFVAFGLLWLSMALGLLLTNKIARVWPGGPTAYALHAYVSVLGLAFGFVHPFLMLANQYSLAQIFVPLAGIGYRTVPVALGQVALILLAIVVPSYAARWIIGPRTWRALHYLTFLVFVLAFAHGLLSGTDSATPLAAAIYWASGTSLLVLAIYRVRVTRAANRRAADVYAGLQKSRARARQ